MNKENFKISEAQIRYKKSDVTPRIVRRSQDLQEIAFEIYDEWELTTRECFYVMFFNRKNEIQSFYEAGKGGMTACIADMKIIFTAALLSGACAMAITHNHPSGNLKPSEQDISLTKKIKVIADLLEIKLLDHIIFCKGGAYYSFNDNAIAPF